MSKLIESNPSLKVSKFIKVAALSAVITTGMEISNLRQAQAEVPIGNITPFDAATMEKTNAGVILQNFNGQQLNGVYLRTNSQELGLTNPNQLNVNASALLKDNNTQNYQLNTKVGDLYPYVNVLNNQGKTETTAGVFGDFQVSPSAKVTVLGEIDSTGNKLIRAGAGIKF
jgi:hypothetical protein